VPWSYRQVRLSALVANLNLVVEQISEQPAALVDAHMFTSVPHSGTGRAACFLAQLGECRARFHP
jgi:hypothetical protein